MAEDMRDNDTKKKKNLVLLGIGIIILLGVLTALLAESLSDSGTGIGLFNHNKTPVADVVTEQQLQEEYQKREELPTGIMDNMDSIIRGELSRGNFEELDEKLQEWDTYKDNEDQTLDESAEIDAYRADIAFFQLVKESKEKPLDIWYFNRPDTLAAAIAFAPVSVKYRAVIDKDSSLLSPARGNINLREAEMSREEYLELLEGINGHRTDDAQFQTASIWDMSILGYECRFIAVTSKEGYYLPYSLKVKGEEEYDITMEMAERIVRDSPDTDLDSIFAAPDETDIYNEPPEHTGESASEDNAPSEYLDSFEKSE